MIRDAEILAKADMIRSLIERAGGANAKVFGSRARGDAKAGSDLDLLVDFPMGIDLLELVALEQDVEALLRIPVQIVTPGALSPLIRGEVLGEAVPL